MAARTTAPKALDAPTTAAHTTASVCAALAAGPPLVAAAGGAALARAAGAHISVYKRRNGGGADDADGRARSTGDRVGVAVLARPRPTAPTVNSTLGHCGGMNSAILCHTQI
eukprot:SAG11_NODE_6483_length_1304_cov_16.550207_2_plen_112_part_00